MINRQPSGQRPYREPYFWLVILLPAAAVLGGLLTFYVALRSDDGLVADDYYKRGLEINRDLRRDSLAAELGLTATLRASRDTGTVEVELRSTRPTRFPERLVLHIAHPTRAGLDHTVTLTRLATGNYLGTVPRLTAGRWYVQVETDDWRIAQTWTLE